MFGWAADFAGCGFWRIGLPMDRLGQLPGWETAASPQLRAPWLPGDATLGEFFDGLDVLVGQRVCLPGPSSIWQEACQRDDVRAVYEVDDDLFNIDPSNTRAHMFFSGAEVQRNIAANLAAADAVTCTTEPLAAALRQHTDAPIRVVPNYLPASFLDLPAVDQTQPCTVGWAGSGTHRMDFEEAGPQVARFLRRNPGIGAVTVGVNFFAEHGIQAELIPWADEVFDYFPQLRFSVGLAPLKHHRFNDAKSHLKALEFAARGIPILASAEPPYERFVQHGVTGFLIRREHEWGHYLRRLVEDPTLRAEMGAAARTLAAGHLIEDHLDEWAAAFTLTPQEQAA